MKTLKEEKYSQLPKETLLYHVAQSWDGTLKVVERPISEIEVFNSSFVGWEDTKEGAVACFLSEQNEYICELEESIDDLQIEIRDVKDNLKKALEMLEKIKAGKC